MNSSEEFVTAYRCDAHAAEAITALLSLSEQRPELKALAIFHEVLPRYAGRRLNFGTALDDFEPLAALFNQAFALVDWQVCKERPADFPEIDWGEMLELAVVERLNDVLARYGLLDETGESCVASKPQRLLAARLS